MIMQYRDAKGRLLKGNPGLMKGKHLTEEHKQKLSKIFKYRVGKDNPAWKGGRIRSANYIYLWMPDHPYCDKKGYVREHRYVMEQSLGRYLEADESIHHKDGNKYNNAIENLELVSWRDHALIHQNWKFRKNLLGV